MIHAVHRKKSMRQAVKIYMLSSLLLFLCLSLFLVNAQAGLSKDTEKCIREGVKRGIIAEKDMLNSAVYKLKASGAKCEDKDDITGKLEEEPFFIDHALPKIQACCQKASMKSKPDYKAVYQAAYQAKKQEMGDVPENMLHQVELAAQQAGEAAMMQADFQTISQRGKSCFKDGLLLSRKIEGDSIYTALCKGVNK
ncbi:MAG: hypothetical protein D3907_02920 [Candidatus Electrothrix sp. AUS3]|nr:hypothetical protein [Candidatus Electrothrix gigas]